jgi:N-carbamoyl-L-amino-acid hydrolase
MTLDVRCADPDRFARARRRIEGMIRSVASERGCTAEWEPLAGVEPVRFDRDLLSRIEGAARGRGCSAMELTSGAGHDAQILARVLPSAMIFVPSRGGLSHCPEERTEPEAVERGANVLLDAWIETAEDRLPPTR